MIKFVLVNSSAVDINAFCELLEDLKLHLIILRKYFAA